MLRSTRNVGAGGTVLGPEVGVTQFQARVIARRFKNKCLKSPVKENTHLNKEGGCSQGRVGCIDGPRPPQEMRPFGVPGTVRGDRGLSRNSGFADLNTLTRKGLRRLPPTA